MGRGGWLLRANGSRTLRHRSSYLPRVGVGTADGARSALTPRLRRCPCRNNARRSTTSGRCAWSCLAGHLNCRFSRKPKGASLGSARTFARSSRRSWDRGAMPLDGLACESLEIQAQWFSVGCCILFMNFKNYLISPRRAAASISYRCSSMRSPLAPARTSDSASGCFLS